ALGRLTTRRTGGGPSAAAELPSRVWRTPRARPSGMGAGARPAATAHRPFGAVLAAASLEPRAARFYLG
ncbi:MAG TPA: hypothetical protein VGM93_07135, partial [Acidimicrobiales bacterium]